MTVVKQLDIKIPLLGDPKRIGHFTMEICKNPAAEVRDTLCLGNRIQEVLNLRRTQVIDVGRGPLSAEPAVLGKRLCQPSPRRRSNH